MFPSATTAQNVIVIDSGIADWKTLVANLSPDISVILLPAGGDGLAALALALADYGTLGALHLVSHGADGRLHLGALRLTEANLDQHGAALAAIASHLTPQSDLLLYGCSVAESAAGQAFVGALSAALNGASVAASTDPTGALALGGDWDLEYSAGRVDTTLPFAHEDIVAFDVATFADDYNTAPAVPANLNLADASDTGSSNTDNLTKSATLTISGTSDPYSYIRIFDGATQLGNTSASYGGAWSYTISSALSQGVHAITANAASGNYSAQSAPSAALQITIDSVAPTLAITSDKTQLKFGATAAITFTFTEDPGTSFNNTDVVVGGGTLSTISGSGLARTATFTPTAGTTSGSGTITVATATYADAAGNANTATSAVIAMAIDLVAPSAPSAPDMTAATDLGLSSTDDLTSNRTPTFSGTAENGTTVRLYDTNGTTWLGNAIASSGTWAITSTTLSAGAHTVTAKATDTAGNVSASSTGLVVTIDRTAPTLAISSSASSLKVGETATITFTFSEDPDSSFTWNGTSGDVVVSGGALGAISGTGLTRTATFTPTAGTNAGTASISMIASQYIDPAGNLGGAASMPSISFDTKAPTVAITSNVAALKIGQTATITFTFSEDPGAGFAWDGSAGDVAVSGGALGAINGSGLTRTATFTPTAGTDGGSASITITSAAYADAAGNGGGAGALPSLSFDTLAPAAPSTPDLASDGGASATDDVTGGGPQTFTGTAEADSTVTLYDTDGTTVLGTAVATGGNWSISSVALATGAHQVTAQATDAAGNVGAASAGLAVVVDGAAPTVAISSDVATLKIGQTATITFTFSEDPGASFTWDGSAGDVAVSGGTLGAISGSGLTRSATFTPAAGTDDGSASITIAPGVYADAAGNDGGAGSTPSLSFDTRAPTVAIGSSVAALKIGETATITFTFSEDPGASFAWDGSEGDVAVSGGTLGAISGAGLIRSATFTPTAGATGGSASITVAAGAYADAAGNSGAAGTTPPLSIDSSAPSVAITSNVAALKIGQSATITFTFSEDPGTSFTWDGSAGDVAVSGGTLGAISGSGLTRSATFTPAAGTDGGSASITIAAGAYADAAGNGGAAGSSPSLGFDTLAPVAPSTPDLAGASDTGVSATDNITSLTRPTFTGTAADGATVTLYDTDGATVLGTGVATGGNWSITSTALGNGAHALRATASDAAGNASAPSAGLNVVIDSVNHAPTGAVSIGGGAIEGQTLTASHTLADADGLGAIAYQWKADGAAIAGATAGSFALTAAQLGKVVTVTAAYVDGYGRPEAVTSAPTDPVAANEPPAPPAVVETVDGVVVETALSPNPVTGMIEQTVTVPVISGTRVDDRSSSHPGLADIGLDVGSAQLVVSLPAGTGLESSGSATLLGSSSALLDLGNRIGVSASTAQQAALEAHGAAFITGLAAGTSFAVRTLTPFATAGAVLDAPLMVSGGATPGQPSAIALVIDATNLPSSALLVLDNVDFAAIVGRATLRGGDGRNYVAGDDAAQNIVLGADDDTLFGGGGNDVIGSAGGDDLLDGGTGDDIVFGGVGNDTLAGGDGTDTLQGGRSDQGQWNFFLGLDGRVVARHNTVLVDSTVTETVTLAGLNLSVPALGFAGAGQDTLASLSLLYQAAFQRAPDLAGLSFYAKTGADAAEFVREFVRSDEWANGLGKLNNADFVNKLYVNALGHAGTAAQLASALQQLDGAADNGAARSELFAAVALGAEHRTAAQGTSGMALGGVLLTQEQGWLRGGGDDRLTGGGGSDLLVGGDGTDTVVYAGPRAQFHILLTRGGELAIADLANGDIDVIRQVEKAQFGDVQVDIGFTQAAPAHLQQVGLLYQTVLGRSADLGGIDYWASRPADAVELASRFIDSAEFRSRAGMLDDAAFVRLMQENALHHAPDAASRDAWTGYLSTHSRAEFVVALVGSAEVVAAQFGAQGLWLA